MTQIDQIIADALAGSPETLVAILAREVVRLRGAPAVAVPAWDTGAFALACVKSGAYAEGDLRDAIKNAEIGYNFAVSRVRAIPADRVLGEGMVAVDRKKIEIAAFFLEEYASRVPGISAVIAALRANQGGADHD